MLPSPENIAAMLPSPKTPLILKGVPMPSAGLNQVVIRIHCIALNHGDVLRAKSGSFKDASPYPYALGCDAAGTIHSTHSSVTSLKIGDRVAATVSFAMLGMAGLSDSEIAGAGAFQHYACAFQQFTVTRADFCIRLPESLGWREAATLPMEVFNAASGIFNTMGIPRPSPSITNVRVAPDEVMFVWGGASSLGRAVVQIAKRAGYRVFVTASAASAAEVRRIGAEKVFDHRDPDLMKRIMAAVWWESVHYVFDAIGLPETLRNCCEMLMERNDVENGEQAILAHSVAWPEDLPTPDSVDRRLIYWGEKGNFPEFAGWLTEWIGGLLEKDEFATGPYTVFEGGLNGLEQCMQSLHEETALDSKALLDIE